MRVLAFAASLRRASLNRKLIAAAAEVARSVKDVIESLGVPHTEVDLVLADGESVDFSWALRVGARVSVYPVFEAIDVAPIPRHRRPRRRP